MSGCTPEYNERTRQMMEEYEQMKARHAEITRNATRQRQLEKQSSSLRQRIETSDTSKPARKPLFQYDEGVQKALLERNRLRSQVEALVEKGERLQRPALQKVLGTVHDLQMASILASLHVFKKLGAAVGSGHILSLVSDVSRTVAKTLIPGVSRIAEQSPRYGKGVDIGSYRARLRGLREAPREAWNQLTKGTSLREAGYFNKPESDAFIRHASNISDALRTPGILNKISETVHAISGKVGATHAAEKEFLAQPEFRESQYRIAQHMAKTMEKQGVPPEKIAEVMSRESTQATIGAQALEHSLEVKLQGKNALAGSINGFISMLDRSKSAGANVAGFVIKTLFPVRKIGMNAATRFGQLTMGGAQALGAFFRGQDLGKLKVAYKEGGAKAMLDKAFDIGPERADYIMQHIGRQGAGIGLFGLLGVLYYNKFGGQAGTFTSKEQKKYVQLDALGNIIKPNESDFAGSESFHSPEFAMMQVAASMTQVYEHEYGKKHGVDLALDVFLKPNLAYYIRTIPYTDSLRRWENTMQRGRAQKGGTIEGIKEIAADQFRSMVIPGIVQQYAAEQDPYKGFRRPRNMKEDIEMGIPGLREEVPIRR